VGYVGVLELDPSGLVGTCASKLLLVGVSVLKLFWSKNKLPELVEFLVIALSITLANSPSVSFISRVAKSEIAELLAAFISVAARDGDIKFNSVVPNKQKL
jgi:hypothetical protein